MLINRVGVSAGSLSAGCIEEEVAMHAHDVIASGKPKLIAFDTRRRFGCSGSIEIFIQPVDNAFMSKLREQFVARKGFEITTQFEPENSFVQTIEPTIRLMILGDGADAKALTHLARFLGWEVESLSAITELHTNLDARTGAVIATHNFGRDCAALRFLLPLDLPYIGLIGPRRRREELLIDVIDSGVEIKSQLFAPAGLHLAAETPDEIALSIIAEIQAVFAGGTAERLRDRKAPIHANTSAECAMSAH